jgi:hypothetical protein
MLYMIFFKRLWESKAVSECTVLSCMGVNASQESCILNDR